MTVSDTTLVPRFVTRLGLDGAYLVIGAGQGIGRQAAHALVQQGADVICVDVDQARIDSVLGELGAAARGWIGDVTKAEEVRRLGRFVEERYGTLSGVVDIVGMAAPRAIADLTEDLWDQQFDISLRHVMLTLRHLNQLVSGDNPSFTFVSSVAAIRGSAYNAAYGAAKAALDSLVRSAAVEFGPRGIRVNAVAPGIVWTPRFAEILGERGRQANVDNTPLGRIAEPADIASALLYLASPMALQVSGHVLVVDGGVNAKFPYPTLNYGKADPARADSAP
ncbi:SDR family oxidoreductase [Dactylosporangium sp. NPDC051485]|uniref:SDR family NAD(P)-dependent oxidoreductase n=1 Tax=Dactylosporangium sp. NPDC051485 TaxID=3154846 RepID=UPI003445969D